MRKLNPNSNNNHNVQMKQSQVKESSYGSQNSDVLSLTSNNSDIIVNKSENQVEAFKQKMSHLLGTRVYESLDDLYSKIKEKVGSKIIKQTSKQLNGMQAALGRVKKNNKEMAKLVTVLGTKVEKSNQKQKTSKPKNTQKDQYASGKLSKMNSQSSSQFYNYHYKKKGHESSNSLSAGQQSFLKDRKQKRREDSKLDASENDRIRYVKPKVRDTLEEEYKWKNRIYEQKVREMLMQLGNIKKELNISHHLPSKFDTENDHTVENRKISKKSKQCSEKIRSSIDSRLHSKQSQYQHQNPNQLKNLQISSSFNPKIVVSEQISSEEITVEKEEKEDKKQIQIKAVANKVSTDTSNVESNGMSIARHVKEGSGGQGNSLLIQKAKGISKMLQEIKAQLTQTTTRSPLPSILQEQQKTNIQLLGSQNFLSQPSNYQLFKREQLTKQQRQILNDKNELNQKDYELQQNNKATFDGLQDHNIPLPKHRQNSGRDSVLDNMNNAQSKIIFADKRIQQHVLFQPQKSYNRIQTPSFTFIPQQNNRPATTISKHNVTNSRPSSNTKPYVMTHPPLNPSNSFSTIPHYTSSGININRPPINKRPSSHLNSHANFAPQVRPYETAHVVPVNRFSKQPQDFINQHLIRTPSFHRIHHPPLIAPYPSFQNTSFLRDKSRSIVRSGRSFSQKRLSNDSLNKTYQNFPPQIVISPGIRDYRMKQVTRADPYTVTLGSSLKKPKRRSISIGSKERSRSKGIDVYSSKQKL